MDEEAAAATGPLDEDQLVERPLPTAAIESSNELKSGWSSGWRMSKIDLLVSSFYKGPRKYHKVSPRVPKALVLGLGIQRALEEAAKSLPVNI